MAASQAEKDAYKIMRRGTRACRECRRRKIRCIYDDDASEVCHECTAHGRDCIKQGTVRGGNHGRQATRNVKVQVTRLESAVERLAREETQPRSNETLGNAAMSPGSSAVGGDLMLLPLEKLQGQSPVFSLFNNDLLRQSGALEAYATEFTSQIKFPDSNASDRDKLLSTIQNIPSILQVLDFATPWWISWREQHFALRKTAGDLTLHDFVQEKLKQDNPAAVALGLMAIAMALGQIRPGIDDLTFNLPVPANHIMNYVLSAVDQIICDSDKYTSQPDSILLFMMRAKHHTENNQLRKSWLRIRQGIRCAQTIGFGTVVPIDAALSEEEAEQQRFIAAIFEIERLISMVLGFPYAHDPNFTDARALAVLLNPSIKDESLNMRALRRILAVTAGHVNDRNAGSTVSDEFTESTQATLNMAAEAMPQGWWRMLTQPLSGLAVHRYESIITQLWYWTVQAYLHMPYLIKPSDMDPAPRYRQMCMDGARNLIRSFNYLRTEPAVSVYMCNCDDFQALLGACILLVGVLQDVSQIAETTQEGPYTPDNELFQNSVDSDLVLIEELKDIFRYRTHEQGGGISKQGLAVLDELTSFLYDDQEQDDLGEGIAGLSEMNININKHEKTIMLPYFGTIKVELTKKIPKRKSITSPAQTMLTPPRSIDDSNTSHSPLQNLSMNYSPVIGDITAVEGFDYQQFNFFPAPSNAYISNDPIPLPPVAADQNDMCNIAMSAPIAWDQWENYMFDQELDKPWNPALEWRFDYNAAFPLA